MTKAQRYTLIIDSPKRRHVSLWTKACQAQGWNKNDRDFRIQKLSEAVGRPIESTTELNNTDDMDRVFDFLREAADDLDAAHRNAHPEEHAGRARRLVHKIREVEFSLTAYPSNAPMGAEGVRRLVRSLCTDIANEGRSQRVEIVDVEDLSAEPIELTRKGRARKLPSQLDQLLVTLNRMLRDYKASAIDDGLQAWSQEIEEDQPIGIAEDAGQVDENVPF